MSWTGAIVLFAVIWFVIFLVVLPRGVQTQGEAGDVVPGTSPSAPADVNIGRKAFWTTVATLVVLGALAIVMEFRILTLDDFGFLYPESYSRSAR